MRHVMLSIIKGICQQDLPVCQKYVIDLSNAHMNIHVKDGYDMVYVKISASKTAFYDKLGNNSFYSFTACN